MITNKATGETFGAVTSGQGVFSVPSLVTGTYTVAISLTGFKSVLLDNVVVNAGVPASVRATLEVGALTEQVIVQSTAELVQTQSRHCDDDPRYARSREPAAVEPQRV